jgi:hypothetical protein
MFYVVFIAEKVDSLGDRGSGYTMINVQTLLEAILDMSLRYFLYIYEAFS